MIDCVIGDDLRCQACGKPAAIKALRRNCEALIDKSEIQKFIHQRASLAATRTGPDGSDSPYSHGLLAAAGLSPGGPGTELKAILRDWLGITPSEGCSCNSMAARMDALGADWCEGDGLREILGVMREEHAKRWEAGETKLPWTDFGATQLVRLACRRARAKAAAGD